MNHSTKTRRLPLFGAALPLIAASMAAAATPGSLTYSGTLLDSDGRPVTSSTTLTFRLYTQATGGTSAWEDPVTIAPDSSGWFAVQLGAAAGNPLDPMLFRQPLWLGIQVATDLQELAPRVALTAAPYALSVDYANVVGLPATYPTTWADVMGKPSSFVATWADVTGKPSLYPSDWANVAGKPSVYPVDSAAVQSRVTGTCALGQYVRAINQDGGVVCGTDANSGGTVTGVMTTGSGNPISVSSGSTTPTLSFKTCASGESLQYSITLGWMCSRVSTFIVTKTGCDISCPSTVTGDYSTITVNSVTIDVPGPGTIAVTFNGSGSCYLSATQVANLYGQITNSSTERAFGYLAGGAILRAAGSAAGYLSGVMHASRTFSVLGPGTYTYYYRANNWDGGGNVVGCQFFGGNMTATYYP